MKSERKCPTLLRSFQLICLHVNDECYVELFVNPAKELIRSGGSSMGL